MHKERVGEIHSKGGTPSHLGTKPEMDRLESLTHTQQINHSLFVRSSEGWRGDILWEVSFSLSMQTGEWHFCLGDVCLVNIATVAASLPDESYFIIQRNRE